MITITITFLVIIFALGSISPLLISEDMRDIVATDE